MRIPLDKLVGGPLKLWVDLFPASNHNCQWTSMPVQTCWLVIMICKSTKNWPTTENSAVIQCYNLWNSMSHGFTQLVFWASLISSKHSIRTWQSMMSYRIVCPWWRLPVDATKKTIIPKWIQLFWATNLQHHRKKGSRVYIIYIHPWKMNQTCPLQNVLHPFLPRKVLHPSGVSKPTPQFFKVTIPKKDSSRPRRNRFIHNT